MSVVAIPTSTPARRWLFWAIAPAAALAAVLVFWLATTDRSGGTPAAQAGMYHTVASMDLAVTITKDGELQAINNLDIVCPVEGQSTIQTIVKEGTSVKKGDVLVVLDASEIKRKVEETMLEVQKAETALITAREQKQIQESQNSANLQEAEVGLTLAQLDLRQYSEGTYPQLLNEAKKKLQMAEITLTNKQEDLAQTRNLFDKGFVTAADVKTSDLEVLSAQNELEKAQTELTVLEKYTHEKDLTSKKNALAQAEQKLTRVKNENASNLSAKIADMISKEQTFELQKYRLTQFQAQLEKCVIRSPADGLVVYPNERSREGQSPLQEGAKVQEQQLLLRLPDTREMKAVLRINEGQVSKIKIDPDKPMRATVSIVGVPEPIEATVAKISVMADSGQRWWNPDLKEYPVDLLLEQTPDNLKPGMTVQANILISRLNDALAVPLPAIYSAGREAYVFVRDGGELRPQKVTLGLTNETHAQIVEGLQQGQEVLLLQQGQGRELLEKSGVKPAADAGPPRREQRPAPAVEG